MLQRAKQCRGENVKRKKNLYMKKTMLKSRRHMRRELLASGIIAPRQKAEITAKQAMVLTTLPFH